jgi:2-methylcitrate dehydratase PrpD
MPQTTASPDDVATSVQQRVLDVLGLCVAAHRLPTSAAAIGHVLDQGGHPQATAVGVPEKVTAAQAAFANGVLAHSLDYDDTHLPSVLHPSASVVPAALAAAEHNGASGEQPQVGLGQGRSPSPMSTWCIGLEAIGLPVSANFADMVRSIA